MHVGDHLGTPSTQRLRPLSRLGLGLSEPISVVVEVVVACPKLERLPWSEVVGPIVTVSVWHATDVLMVEASEGVSAIRVEHRIDEHDDILQHFERRRIASGGEVLQQLQRPFAARKLEAVNRSAEPDDGRLIRQDDLRLRRRG